MQPTVYGYADQRDVEKLIRDRVAKAKAGDAKLLASLLGEATFALLEINNSIPVHAKQRHLVASALENFAEGK
jgi:hypothetical protein